MGIMDIVDPLLLICAGILAASGLIIAKKPSAAKVVASLKPFQRIFGVVLLVWNIYWWIHIGFVELFRGPSHGWYGLTWFVVVLVGVLLGVLFGMPLLGRTGVSLSKKVAPYHTMLGLIAIAAGLVALLYYPLKILTP